MASVDALSIAILFGALLALAGILSSLVALRFGAPLLLIFLLLGMLAGESGLGGIKFDDVGSLYVVGSIALALILFDGGLRTRLNTFRSVLAPAASLATIGVLLTAIFTAPAVMLLFGFHWMEALLVGALLASTDAAAVFFLIHARGLRLRPRVGATLEVESGINDPFAILLTLILLEFMVMGDQSWQHVLLTFVKEAGLGGVVGLAGGWAIVLVLNRLSLPQGLHAPFVTMGALVIFGVAAVMHASGFLAVYLAGLIVGNRPTRAHNTVVVFLDAITWLAQIAMFTLLGLLAWPSRLPETILASLVVAVVLMLVARPAAVFLSLLPFRYPKREKVFVSWVGLRGAVSVFLASIPLLVGLPNAPIYFDIAFVVVVTSLLIQGWTISPFARYLGLTLPPLNRLPRRIELDLPGQLGQELVGYAVGANSPYLRRRLIPSWAKPTLLVRNEQVLPASESDHVQVGDYVYLLAPPEKAEALDRFFMNLPPQAKPDAGAFGDFFVSGDVTLGSIAETYDLQIAAGDAAMTLAEDFAAHLMRPAKRGDLLPLGSIALIAHTVVDGRVTNVGLRLTDSDADKPQTVVERVKRRLKQFR
jgi:cell volume regulation protein A